MIDGTFKSIPLHFYQTVMIHGWYEDFRFVCVYAFMANKTEASYMNLLNNLKLKALELKKEIAPNFMLQPTHLMCDFEPAIHNAFKFHFPSVQIRGCHIHFT